MITVWYRLRTLRIHQWVKNLLVFVALIFANRLQDATAWAEAIQTFFAFSFIASAVYIVNDLIDKKTDAHHPIKKYRPIASGRISTLEAILLTIVMMFAGFGLASNNRMLLLILMCYVVLQCIYNTVFKHKMLADVISIAIGFVLRAIAGAVAINVAISPWLIICTFCLCLFLGFCKRYNEIRILDQNNGKMHRKTLEGYTPELLTHLITLSATLAIVTFLLYATNQRTIQQFGTEAFIYTLPLIIYCICRAAMQSMKGAYSGPTELMLKDKALLAGIIVWMVMMLSIMFFADKIKMCM